MDKFQQEALREAQRKAKELRECLNLYVWDYGDDFYVESCMQILICILGNFIDEIKLR